MKIRSVETYTQGSMLCVVRVVAEDGSEGWGQCAPFNADITAQVLPRQVAPLVLGEDPLVVDEISDRVVEGNYKFPWSYVCRALAGVDTALWDLRGRVEGKSVCELLGGEPRLFPVYGSSMRRDITAVEEARRLMRLQDECGFNAFKIRVGSTCGHDEDEWPGRTDELVPAIRRAVGPGVALLADGNSCYGPKLAIEVGHLLQDYGYCHFEEPCPYWELEWTAEVRNALDIDVAGGEQDTDLAQWRRMVEMRAVDIVQPDVCYVGGVTRALRVAEMARKAGLVVVPHSANPSMVTVFALHLMGAVLNAGPYVEYGIEESPWLEGLFEPVLKVEEGRVAIPSGPGWGVEIQKEWLDKAKREVSEGE